MTLLFSRAIGLWRRARESRRAARYDCQRVEQTRAALGVPTLADRDAATRTARGGRTASLGAWRRLFTAAAWRLRQRQ